MGRKLLILSVLVFLSEFSYSQGTAGKDFWVAFLDAQLYCHTRDTQPIPLKVPPLVLPGPFDQDTLELYITSRYKAKVTVQGDNKIDATVNTTFVLTPGQTYCLRVHPYMSTRNIYSDQVMNFSVHVTSDSLINVQAVNRFWSSKGSTTVIPTESIPWSPEYFVTTNESDNQWLCEFIDFWGDRKIYKSAEFVVVGISDTSLIEVIPAGESCLIHPGYDNKPLKPYNVTLKKGETYHYMTTDPDLTGSIIRARNSRSKFAVFAGNRQTYSNPKDTINFPCQSSFPYVVYDHNKLDDLASVDHTYEQMFPTVTIGNTYTAMPFKNNDAGYFLKILVIENNTRVSIDGQFYKKLNQGNFFVLNVGRDSVKRITADKRISVTQFAKGNKCNGHPAPKTTMGDVSQLQLVSDQQWTTEANISRVTNTPRSKWVNSNPKFKPENYLNVLVKGSDTAQFRMNGKPVPNNLWKKTSVLPGYRYAQIDIDTFNYRLTSPKGFAAYTYGYGNFEGYAYFAGANFSVLHNDFTMNTQCRYDTILFAAVKNDSFKNYTWNFGDNTTGLTGTSARKVFNDSGYFNVTMYCTNIYTNAIDSVVKKIYISIPNLIPPLSLDTVVCGKLQYTVYSKNFSYFNTYLWQDGRDIYYREFRQPGLYWEKVTHRNGCVFIDSLLIRNFPNPEAKFTSTDSVFCSNGTREISFTNLSTSLDTIQTVNWDFGDYNKNDTSKVVRHIYKKADLYQVTLNVTTKNGCNALATQLVNILQAPLVKFNITNADSCFNSNNFTFKNLTLIDTPYHVKYKWNFGEGTTITNRNPLSPRTYPLPGKYTVSLMYENNNGCYDTLKKYITIYTNPKSIFSFTSKGQCLKDSIKFTNTSTSLHLPLKSKWEFGDTKTDTVKNPIHLYNTKGSYTIRHVAISPQGCKDTSVKQVKVYGGPTVKFSINDSIQCLADNKFTFLNRSTTDTGGFKLRQWTFSDGAKLLNTDTAVRTYTTAGKPTIQLKVTNIFGCSDSLKKSFEIKKGPLAQFSVNTFSQCFNAQSFAFNYIPQPGNDSISGYAWYLNNDSVKNTPAINNFKFPADGQYQVRLKLYSKYACDGEVIKKVFVNPEPLAKFTVLPPEQCFKGHSFKITNQSMISKGNLNVSQWDFGDATTSGLLNPPDKKYTLIGNYPITYRVVSDSGCFDTASANVKLYPNATITIPPVKAACLDDSVTFSSSASVSSGSIASYLWDFGDGQGGVTANTKHKYGVAGNYTATVKTLTDHNCRDSNSVNIRVVNNPVADFTYTHFNRDDAGIRFQFTDQSAFANSWNWAFGKVGNSTLQNPDYIFTDTGNVMVRLIVSNQNTCFDTLDKLVPILDKIIFYFPNVFSPNGNGLNDGFGLDPGQFGLVRVYRLRVYNRWGEMLFDNANKEEHWLIPDDPNILQGVYIYKAEIRDIYNKYHEIRGRVEVLR